MLNIKRKLKFYVSYWLFWLGYFIVARIVFIFFNWNKIGEIESGSELLASFFHGAKLDLSSSGYLLLLPTLLFLFFSFFKKNYLPKIILAYTSILIFLISFFIISDASLYGHWGNKLDFHSTFYLKNANEVLNFVPVNTLLFNILSFFILAFASYFFYRKKIHPQLQHHQQDIGKLPVLFLLLAGLTIIPIRGGIGKTPINLSKVYFSNNTFANHSAINVLWNIVYTFSEREKLYQKFNYTSKENIKPTFQELYPLEDPAPSLLKNQNPNIIFIILESFTASLIDNKWKGIEITPNLNRLKTEGIYFSNFYANGDRTDEGLVSILSGFPAQPISYIINYQNKTAQLPSLIKDLKTQGYQTAFYYGGDVNFANMKSFLLQSGVEKIMDKKDFLSQEFNAKWGVHDHIVFDKLLEEIHTAEKPFFKTLLTLSSHPPFDTPIPNVIEGSDDGSLFANSANYTDQALGDFLEKFQATSTWENTLVVLVADHGVPYLNKANFSSPSKYKIPMIWLGGALKNTPQEISKFASQTDIVNTLLGQIGKTNSEFEYSKNILSPTSKSFSFYTFNHGYGFLTDSTTHIFNYRSKTFYKKEGITFPDSIGHSYLQKISIDFSNH